MILIFLPQLIIFQLAQYLSNNKTQTNTQIQFLLFSHYLLHSTQLNDFFDNLPQKSFIKFFRLQQQLDTGNTQSSHNLCNFWMFIIFYIFSLDSLVFWLY